jgi:hypothetical protein
MKLLAFFTVFACAVGYKVETVSTSCFMRMMTLACHQLHAQEVATAINNGSVYISHSTTPTSYDTMIHTIIVYK